MLQNGLLGNIGNKFDLFFRCHSFKLLYYVCQLCIRKDFQKPFRFFLKFFFIHFVIPPKNVFYLNLLFLIFCTFSYNSQKMFGRSTSSIRSFASLCLEDFFLSRSLRIGITLFDSLYIAALPFLCCELNRKDYEVQYTSMKYHFNDEKSLKFFYFPCFMREAR